MNAFISFYFCSENFAQTASVSVGRHLLGRIASLVSNWYSYTYDGTPQDIADGGNDMYDSGNRVRKEFLIE